MRQDISEIIWDLFVNQADTNHIYYAKLCARIAKEYDFDIGVLPDKLYEKVYHILGEEERDSYAYMEAICAD